MSTFVSYGVAGALLLAVAAYSTAGGTDYGAGIWDLLAGRFRHTAEVRALIDHAMAPVWEANNVWLVFSAVVCWTGFPLLYESVFPVRARAAGADPPGSVLRISQGRRLIEEQAARLARVRPLVAAGTVQLCGRARRDCVGKGWSRRPGGAGLAGMPRSTGHRIRRSRTDRDCVQRRLVPGWRCAPLPR